MSTRLSPRLTEIIRLCGRGRVIADIGCDHAFVCIRLVEGNAYGKALAMDVRPGPLAAASANIREAGLSGRIETRLSDGLEKLRPGEADTVLIAGMGGDLIMRILEAGMDRLSPDVRLVLGPQSHVPEVRAYLQKNGFRITEEVFLADDGKYYALMTAERGEDTPYSEEELAFGRFPIRRQDPVLEAWLSDRCGKLAAIIDSLKDVSTKQSAERIHALTSEKTLAEAALRQIRRE